MTDLTKRPSSLEDATLRPVLFLEVHESALPHPYYCHSQDFSLKDLEGVVDKDIAEFDQYMQGLGNERLVPAERAIVKTYIAWKLQMGKGAKTGA